MLNGAPAQTKIISVHRLRRSARKVERDLQSALETSTQSTTGPLVGLPAWAKGVRVDRAGFFQYAVVATSWKGH